MRCRLRLVQAVKPKWYKDARRASKRENVIYLCHGDYISPFGCRFDWSALLQTDTD